MNLSFKCGLGCSPSYQQSLTEMIIGGTIIPIEDC